MSAAKAHNTTLFSGLKQAVQIDILHPVMDAVCALDPCARLSPPAGNLQFVSGVLLPIVRVTW